MTEMEPKVKFGYIGWCNEVDSKGHKHDKVWCYFSLGENWYACWGGRGKAVTFKRHDSEWSVRDVMQAKKKKYQAIDKNKLLSIWPTFFEQAEQRLVFALLANKVR